MIGIGLDLMKKRGGASPPDGIPSGLVLTVISDTSIQLDWTINSTNQDGHSIERSSNGVDFVEVSTVLGLTSTYTDTGLGAGDIYAYRVSAFKGSSFSLYSDLAYEVTYPKHLTFEAANISKISVTSYAYRPDDTTSWGATMACASDVLSGDFSVSYQTRTATTYNIMIGLRNELLNTAYNGASGGYDYFVFTNGAVLTRGYNGGNIGSLATNMQQYDIIRLRRVSGTIYVDYYRGATGWQNALYTFPNTTTANLYCAIAFGGETAARMYYPIKDLENGSFYSKMLRSVNVHDGNSLIQGSLGTAPSTLLLSMHPTDINYSSAWLNYGTGGQTSAQMESDASTQIDPLISVYNDYLFTQEVGNSIFYGSTPRQAVDDFWVYCDHRRTAGFKVFIGNVHARQNISASDISAANILINAEWSSHADGIFNLAARTELSDYNNVTYFNADKVHLTNAGYAIWAIEMKKAFLKYLISV